VSVGRRTLWDGQRASSRDVSVVDGAVTVAGLGAGDHTFVSELRGN
jgi:hypothetical protein